MTAASTFAALSLTAIMDGAIAFHCPAIIYLFNWEYTNNFLTYKDGCMVVEEFI